MRDPLWPPLAWYLRRQLTPDQFASVSGDLAEDLAKREREIGLLRAQLWLIRESVSLARAYRSYQARERRQSRRIIMGASSWEDARLAWRRLTKRPAATAASITALACGIAAATVTWSALSAVLLHPLPVDAPDRLFVVAEPYPEGGPFTYSTEHHSYPQFLAIRESGIFESVIGHSSFSTFLVEQPQARTPEERLVHFVSHDYFSTLGVRPPVGRGFMPAEDRRGAPAVAVLADVYWRNEMGADPDVVGRTLLVSGTHVTVVGVAPREFRGLQLAESPDIYMPLHATVDERDAWSRSLTEGFSWIRIVIRLKPRTSAAQAEQRLRSIPDQWPRTAPDLVSVNEAATPAPAREGLRHFAGLLGTVVGLLLAAGCMTVGMLLLVRTEARRDELAMCLALGGTRASLARGIVIEGTLLSWAGAALLVPLAMWLFSGSRSLTLPGPIDLASLNLSLDMHASVVLAGGAIAAMLLISLIAAGLGSGPNVADALRSRAGGTPRVTRRRARAAIVAVQVATAVVLLSGAVLFSRSLTVALGINAGFDASRIVTADLPLARHGYTAERMRLFARELRDRLHASPGVASASVTYPLNQLGPGGRRAVNGAWRDFPSVVWYRTVDDGYFSTMGLPILQGRNFSPSDTTTAPKVVIVSESLARAIAGESDPIGVRLSEWLERGTVEVIGVVPDVITRVTDTAPLIEYYPGLQEDPLGQRTSRFTVVLRAASDPVAAMRTVESAIRDIDSRVTPTNISTIEDQLRQQMGPQTLGRFVLGSLGIVAIVLALLGAYVLAETMSVGRRREFTIRRALGATRISLSGLVVTDTLRLVGLGLVGGLVLAWISAGAIRAFMFRVEPLDPAVLLPVAGAILAVTIVVSLKPAIDAARVDMTRLLRDE